MSRVIKNRLLPAETTIFTALKLFLIVVLVLGIFFRFVNLDRKVYWLDETHTSLRIFGYTEPEFIKDIFAGEVVNSEDLLKYQNPSPEKSWSDTIRIVAGNTEHAPLYYLALRLWTQGFGSSIIAIRSFSALISLLAFPFIYWLCRELFESPFVAWIAVALIAISPFHILYAQEARPYSLLIVTILLSGAALLRAIRLNTNLGWGGYAITLILGLYTHWFFTVVAVSHGLYVAITERLRPTKRAIAYLLSSLAGVLAFSPWIINTITAPPPLKEQMGWVFRKIPFIELVKAWNLHISRVFFDLDKGWCLPPGASNCRYLFSYDELLLYVLIIPFVVLAGYSIYWLCCKTPKRVWLFVLTLIGIMALAVIIPDLLKGGQRSTVTRYIIPCLLGLQLAIAYLLATKITENSGQGLQPKLWQFILVGVISLGVLSSVLSSQAYAWWTKGENYHVYPIANLVNQAERPLLIYSVPSNVLWGKGGAVGRVMPLCRLLDKKVGILFVVQPNLLQAIPNDFSDLFLYRPHQELQEWVKQKATLEPVDNSDPKKARLWKVTK